MVQDLLFHCGDAFLSAHYSIHDKIHAACMCTERFVDNETMTGIVILNYNNAGYTVDSKGGLQNGKAHTLS